MLPISPISLEKNHATAACHAYSRNYMHPLNSWSPAESQLYYQLGVSQNCTPGRLLPRKLTLEPENGWPQTGDSYWKAPFSGSKNFGGVNLRCSLWRCVFFSANPAHPFFQGTNLSDMVRQHGTMLFLTYVYFFEKPPIPKPPTKSIAVLVRNPELNCYLPLLPLDPKTMKNRGFTPPKVAPWYWAGA